MSKLIDHVRREMEAANAAKAMLNGENTPENENRAKALADQLRELIKEGLSDECSICLMDFQQPVITPCAHIYCRYGHSVGYVAYFLDNGFSRKLPNHLYILFQRLHYTAHRGNQFANHKGTMPIVPRRYH